MTSTRFVLRGDDRDRLAVGYVNPHGAAPDPRVPRAEHRGRGYRVPSGGLYGTVGDLARLGMALTGALPLVPDSLRGVMLTAAEPVEAGAGSGPDGDVATRGRRAGYGLGVQLLDLGAFTLAGHSGTVPGYAAYLLVDPERRAGVVLLRSYNRGATNLGAAATRVLLALRDGRAP
jgi:CubicO group peptidase (beta-lactamase class C family)